MLAVALLCCLALVQGGTVPDHEPYADDQDSDDHEFDNMMDRLRELDIHMNRLIAKTVQVHDEFNDKVHDREAAQTKATNLKLRMAKGDHVCKKGYFRCNSAEDQCVSDMLVCDGEKDCHDGSDEDELVCTVLFKEGDELNFRMIYDTCSISKPAGVTAVIESVERNEHMPSYCTVKASFRFFYKSAGGVKDMIKQREGLYKFGRREISWFRVGSPYTHDDVAVTYHLYPDEHGGFYIRCIGYSADKQCALYVESDEIESYQHPLLD